ncbi:MAG TPA: bile acid:sodium symporter [Gammaproteobacteria bacterium]|jgi:BASS family bile acid:Na+ symporter|nr:bile acid:sodium symporter [Gammaproteobacteria bacterium]
MMLDHGIQIALPVALMMIMASLGLKLQLRDFQQILASPRAYLVGLVAQLVIVPMMGLLAVYVSGIGGATAVGLMVLSFSPGGSSSNLFSDLARGNVALSVSLTLTASVVTPFTLPLLTAAALAYQGGAMQGSFPVLTAMLRLFVVMVIPLAAAMALRHYSPSVASRVVAWFAPVASLSFAVVIGLIVLQQWPRLPAFMAQAGWAIGLLLGSTLGAGYGLARGFCLRPQDRRTITIEAGMQNGGMALLVTEGLLRNPQMSVVPVLYGLLMLIPVILMVRAARREKPAIQ